MYYCLFRVCVRVSFSFIVTASASLIFRVIGSFSTSYSVSAILIAKAIVSVYVIFFMWGLYVLAKCELTTL